MANVRLPRGRVLLGRRSTSVTTTGEMVMGGNTNTDRRTMAGLLYFTANENGWMLREQTNGFLYGFEANSFAWSRQGPGPSSCNSGTAFVTPIINQFVWIFSLDNGTGNLPDNAYCLLGKRAVIQTSGWATRQAATGTYFTTPDPTAYGSRDNATGFVTYPFYIFGFWSRVLTLDEMTQLGHWHVPLDAEAFVLNDTGRDLTGNGHTVTFNDLKSNSVENNFPALRIPE